MTRPIWTHIPSGEPVDVSNPDTSLVGYLPQMLDDRNPAKAAEQLHKAYAHGGGWRPFGGFVMAPDGSIKYPGDPSYRPLATAKLRDETLFFYNHAWVAIVQPSGTYEIARMD